MKAFTALAGALLGLLVGAALDAAVMMTTGEVFPPVISLTFALVGFGLGLAFATRRRTPRQPIDPDRYPNRIISRRPR